MTSLEDVQNILLVAKAKYDIGKKDSKGRMWIVKLTERVHFYGSILDVFAQHHPEYVALAWGSIKFLLVVVIFYPFSKMTGKLTIDKVDSEQ